MISVIVYGRNDSHGYNLHRRASISLNAISEVLDCENDEILFVDYNSPDDFPTFPEAISDTLTDKAKNLIKIFRIRPTVHAKIYGNKTHLVAIEPLARNVALRRSNPENRWILSTNTDMIFLPKGSSSLSEAVKNLPDGYYVAPRFELPETMWESFSRMDAKGNLMCVATLSKSMHLEEITLSDLTLYDAPGDFQLMTRDALFEINGFDERMIHGWHVDSNISKRLEMFYGQISDGAAIVDSYHCDHTRQVTTAHKANAKSNSWQRFVTGLDQSDIVYPDNDWGLNSLKLESVSLEQPFGSDFCKITSDVLAEAQDGYYFSSQTVSPKHILPYLFDLFCFTPKNANIVWIGFEDEMLNYFATCLNKVGYIGNLTTFDVTKPLNFDDVNDKILSSHSTVINYGVTVGQAHKNRHEFFKIFAGFAEAKVKALYVKSMPRFVTINAHGDHFCGTPLFKVTNHFIMAIQSPFNTRVKYGYYNPEFGNYDNFQQFSVYDDAFANKSETINFFRKQFDRDIHKLANFAVRVKDQTKIERGFLLRLENASLKHGDYVISLKLLNANGKNLYMLATNDNLLLCKFSTQIKSDTQIMQVNFPIKLDSFGILNCNFVCEGEGEVLIDGFEVNKTM
jgi:hypothetical protein